MVQRKVLRIIDRLNIGGPAIHCLLLTQGLAPRFTTILVSGQVSRYEGDMAYLADYYQIRPHYLSRLQRQISPLADLATFWQLLQIIRRYQPDIVHTHKSKAGALGRLAAILLGVPIIIHTFHGHVFHSYFSVLKSRVFIAVERFLARFTDRIVVLSERQYQEISVDYHIAPQSKLKIVHLGFDFTRLAHWPKQIGRLRRRYHLPADAPLIGIIGRLTPVKNQALFLNAAAEVRRHCPNARFLLIGDGELKSQLQYQAQQLGLSDRVLFTGWIEDPGEIYADLDIVVLTSHNEGTPVTLIEAMYCGRPVVATDVGGVADVVSDGENGVLIADNDSAALVRALVALVNDDQRRQQLANKANAAVAEKFSRERLVAEITALYRCCLDEADAC